MLNAFVPADAAQVLVVGDLILDRYVHGHTTRISPEAPVPVVRVSETEERPGGAANVALNVRALGVPVHLLGVSGEDTAADLLSGSLSDKQVACDFVRQPGFPTITKLRVLSQHQQLIRLDYESEAREVDTQALSERYKKALSQAAVVVLSDYAKGSLAKVEQFIQAARERGQIVLVDPKGVDFERYSGASLLTPNLKEFEAVAGPCADEQELHRKAKELCRSLSVDALLVTRGEQGMSLIQSDTAEPMHLPAQAHEVFDVTGAGDTVIAAVAAALASAYDLREAVQYANHAAGLVVEKLGTASITVEELNTDIAQVKSARSCVIEVEALAQKTQLWRQQGKKIVMTNGCFDLLHAGHVQYLQQARALGDCLIVAVNDDQSVQRLKGQTRPITKLAERMTVLAALAAVDWVVAFSEDTPARLIERLRPHVLVKGGDYQVDQIAGADLVQDNGGEVVVLPFQPGCSTTQTLNRILGQDS